MQYKKETVEKNEAIPGHCTFVLKLLWILLTKLVQHNSWLQNVWFKDKKKVQIFSSKASPIVLGWFVSVSLL